MSFEIAPQQHQEWFIGALLLHIRLPLMQQKVASQEEELAIVMKLEASPIAKKVLGWHRYRVISLILPYSYRI